MAITIIGCLGGVMILPLQQLNGIGSMQEIIAGKDVWIWSVLKHKRNMNISRTLWQVNSN